jgi:hypothetical protein
MDVLAAFPAIIFTALLGFVLVYWTLVILGALDLDLPFTEMSGASLFGGLLALVGLGSVPFPISFSLIVLGGWGWAVLGTHWLVLPLSGVFRYLAGFAVLALALSLGVLLAAVLLYPLRRFFISPATGPTQLIGKPCLVTTAEVSEDFGQGVYREGGRELILSLRAHVPLKRGQKALIVDYDAGQRAYWVAPYEDFLD